MKCPINIPADVWNALPKDIQAELADQIPASHMENVKLPVAHEQCNLFSDQQFGINSSSIDGRKILAITSNSSCNSDSDSILCNCKLKSMLRQVNKDGPNQGKTNQYKHISIITLLF